MKYLPINIKLKGQSVLVLGAGSVAIRKIKTLLSVHAKVICIANNFNLDIKALAAKKDIKTIHHDLKDLSILEKYKNVRLIISATNNPSINKSIHHYGQIHNMWVNTVDQQDLCDFITPAVVDRSPVVVSISSEGAAPVLVRIIKQKIEYLLPSQLGVLAEKARKIRQLIKNKIPKFNNRRRFWETYFDWSHHSNTVFVKDYKKPNSDQIFKAVTAANETTGKVSLVGAGPGNTELLTLKAIKVLQTADVVLHDHLITDEILSMIRKDADLIDVGKQAGNHKTKQQNINQLLIKHAQKGLHVCRLKGGDSFVFGRGGEEVQALKEQKIYYEIVPGITAAVGCAAYAGIPLTHRDHAQSLVFITAHCSNSIDTIDWSYYAKEKQTLAVYMGLIKAEHLTMQLISHGKKPKEPVAIIENGTRSTQRTVVGQLDQLPDMISGHSIKSPALIVIGEVAQYATQFDWYKQTIKHHELIPYSKTA